MDQDKNKNKPIEINPEDIDISSFSKPLTYEEKPKSSWDNLMNWWEGTNKKISIKHKEIENNKEILSEDKISAKPKIEEKKPDNLEKKQDNKGSHSQITNSKKADVFFRQASDEKPKREKEDFWLDNTEETKIAEPKNTTTSIAWLIGGALTVLLIVIGVMASFAGINYVKDYINKQTVSTTQQVINQAKEMVSNGKLEEAKEKALELAATDGGNSDVKLLLDQINNQIGKKIIDMYVANTEQDSSPVAWEAIYQDPKGHFSVAKNNSWQLIDSDYDAKFNDGSVVFGVKKYPKTKSLTELQDIFLETNRSESSVILNKKENISFLNANAMMIAREENNYYIMTILTQKYFWGYEISGWIPKESFNENISLWSNWSKSFALIGNYQVASLDGLSMFGNDNFVFHAWPEAIKPEEQNWISEQFKNSLQKINQTLETNWQEKINVYLYPNWETFYQYTLADNSFSDLSNKDMHIVYRNPEDHQSFGYETTKIIYQNNFNAITEPLVKEGLAVMLDQTGRPYAELIKQSKYYPLNNLLGVGWETTNGNEKYFEAGVFADYLIKKYGIDLYINLAKENSFPDAYEKVYNKSLDLLEIEMKTELVL